MLQIRNLQVNYGESTILSEVNLDVPPGQVVCLMGRNGVGKTTLMKSIMGLLKLRQGAVHFEGEEITRWSTSRRARGGIGYVPQGRGIFPHLTVYENLLLGFEALPDRRPDSGALDEVFELFPALQTMQSRMAGNLSGGQQQQLAFGRVLVRRPKLLLLDEPTEGIQPSIMLEIKALIRTLREQQKMTILLVEQILDFALGVGDYFYIMETGAIVLEAPARAFNEEMAKGYLAI